MSNDQIKEQFRNGVAYLCYHYEHIPLPDTISEFKPENYRDSGVSIALQEAGSITAALSHFRGHKQKERQVASGDAMLWIEKETRRGITLIILDNDAPILRITSQAQKEENKRNGKPFKLSVYNVNRLKMKLLRLPQSLASWSVEDQLCEPDPIPGSTGSSLQRLFGHETGNSNLLDGTVEITHIRSAKNERWVVEELSRIFVAHQVAYQKESNWYPMERQNLCHVCWMEGSEVEAEEWLTAQAAADQQAMGACNVCGKPVHLTKGVFGASCSSACQKLFK